MVLWALTGPLFGYSDTWQLVINTSTTIVTFLMVFLIQHTQNRDTIALQAKLAELIIAMHGAENKMATIEDLSEEELEQLHETYRDRAEDVLHRLVARTDNQSARPPARLFAPSPFRSPAAGDKALAMGAENVQQWRLEHDPEKWRPVFGKDHAPPIS